MMYAEVELEIKELMAWHGMGKEPLSYGVECSLYDQDQYSAQRGESAYDVCPAGHGL